MNDGTQAGDLPRDVALQKELGVALLLLAATLRAQLLLRDVEYRVLPVPLVDPRGREETRLL